MDSVDYKILKILQKNARESASNISKEIHLSVSAVTERIRKMEDSGVIKGYTIVVDDRKVGFAMTVLMEVRLENPRFYDGFVRTVEDLDEIVACYYKTGEFDLLLKISCDSGDELADIHKKIMNIDGVFDTKTDIIVKNVKNTYSAIKKADK
ncbi:MAG: Lrp/AsnC family transcriptional regulator [Candidatus Alectryocaccobium sp.]|jgi:Lrp/AsnC family leucine-responsive transcriptional regulator|nr:Lrp/AsnC family transcriptional regulator [Lachnospiraceae bacterium]MDY6221333.1 Lrp/AsnC family transcriptional regulator [Candidatus Alectryocaccobium sp.]